MSLSPLSIFFYFFIALCFLQPFQMFLHLQGFFHSPPMFETLFLRWWPLILPHLFQIYYQKSFETILYIKKIMQDYYIVHRISRLISLHGLFPMRRSTVPYSGIEYIFFSFTTEISLKFGTSVFRVLLSSCCGGEVTVIFVRYVTHIIAVVAIILWWMFSFYCVHVMNNRLCLNKVSI